ncbi:MAG: hypothetical protein ACXWJK_10185 [Burkholderiaceae bacterium]
MKSNKFLLSILFAISAQMAFADDLTPIEQKRELLVYTTLMLDAAQTLDIKNHPNLYETNPLLGRHPSDTKIVAYFIGAGFAHDAVTKALPTEYRATWQYGWAALEIGTIIRNRKLNLRFNF